MEKDDLYEVAFKLVVTHQMASPSFLQRKLKVNYNRANRIIDQLEEEGVIGKSNGVRAREVLITQKL